MMRRFAIAAPRIFDGSCWHADAAILVEDGAVLDIVPRSQTPSTMDLVEIDGLLAPGFVDLQVNGGGGVMLNDRQDVDAIRTICAAHAQFGTTALLPTLITDTPAVTSAAVAAGVAAAEAGVPGFAGLHLEGPHLSLARKGAHDPKLIRPLEDADEAFLIAARQSLPALLTTIAPESAGSERIRALAEAGVTVSIGHTDCSSATALAFADAGARMATHLFNAMSQMGNREPGLVGAVLDSPALWAGLIADGIHVDASTIGIALRAKREPGRIFLVTDAMAPIGTRMTSFTLNGRTIRREDGRLTLEDGTLAGADLDMISAVRFVHRVIGLDLEEALRMASTYPAEAMGFSTRGRLTAGSRADIVAISPDLQVSRVWIGGAAVFMAG
jgi:N-acetylglucosamine-6-phosphate deacetylase